MENNKVVVVISGYFGPPHAHHIEYAKNARKLAGDTGIVYAIVNNDHQVMLKKGFKFLPEDDRLAVIDSVRYINKAFLSIDTDRTVVKTIEYLVDNAEFRPTIFFNEGDCTKDKPCAEEEICKKYGVEINYGSGKKLQSSSWILEDALISANKVLKFAK
jgi:cytidyltransferase-like protein